MNMKTITHLETRETIDQDGEIKTIENTKTIKIKQEEDYIKLYIKHINYLNDLPLGLESLIYQILKYVTFGNQIIINSSIKRKIAENLDKKFNTVNQYITKLVNLEILIREDRGVYYLNPLLYGKGKWEDILKLREKLEINIEYKEDSYTITHKHNRQKNLSS